ncbi:hypothetical protein CVT26_001624, partial [Gymnopilus dilepis]
AKPAAAAGAASFKEAKEARQTRVAVGGGIFKKNGESVLFKTRGGSSGDAVGGAEEPMDVDAAPTSGTSGTSGVPTQTMAQLNLNLNQNTNVNVNGQQRDVQEAITNPKAPVDKAPTTLFEFVRLWERLGSVEERWGLINMIPPNEFPSLVKLSLEPAQLVSIFEVFLAVLQSLPSSQNQAQEQLKTRIKEYLDAFTRIPRFATLLLFLSKSEKEVVRGVLESVFGGVGVGGVWKGVA